MRMIVPGVNRELPVILITKSHETDECDLDHRLRKLRTE